MKGVDSTSGFTIVETMIVLAITGILLTSVIAVFSNRQSTTEFFEGIRAVYNQLQGQIGQVASGYYSQTAPVHCTNGLGQPPQIQSGSNNLGTNLNCVYLGEVFQFSPSGNAGKYNVLPIAGTQFDDLGNPLTDWRAANPTAIVNGSSRSLVDSFGIYTLPYGIQLATVKSGASNIGAFGLFTSANAGVNSGSTGSNSIDLVAIPGSSLGQSPVALASDIQSINTTTPINPSGGVQLCFNSGGTQQSGVISIGADNSRTGMKLIVNSGLCP